MNIAQEIFVRKRPVREKALQYGFTPASQESGSDAGGILTYRESIMNGDLSCEIIIREDSTIKCRVVDSYTGEEYAPVNIETYSGSYVGTVRGEYRNTLSRIAENCFDNVPFAMDQANRISYRIEKEYGVRPEWPFKKDSGAVFRHNDSGSWFAIDMYIERGKLEGNEYSDPDAFIDVMNVKIDPDKLDDLLSEPGIYRCYHMNKKMWVTFVLDDTLPDERIMDLIRTSFELTASSGKNAGPARRNGEKMYWLIPSNPANYDVAKGFRDSGNNTIPWHHRISVLPGDIIYIYQTEPVAAIMYRCEVVRSFLPRPVSWSGYAPSSKYRMDIRLLQAFDKTEYPREWMNEHGIKKTVRGQRSAPPELVREIEDNVKKIE